MVVTCPYLTSNFLLICVPLQIEERQEQKDQTSAKQKMSVTEERESRNCYVQYIYWLLYSIFLFILFCIMVFVMWNFS